ncbi:unnamed protein product [Ilex paraguariensis]|uniref:DNA polymerase kappa n=1 Tax=Ilex paraguariensis TaxID=185542 RepID=A0ABC8R8N8_9AQUA
MAVLSHCIHYAKAGMDGVDKEKVQRIVYEMSKGSKYFQNEEKKEADMKQKIENMRARYAKLTAADISHYQKIADKRILELEATRDLSRIWLHVDMDAFYAAVETLSNPSLKGKPMAVGGMSMISTANYEARRFGVRAAMPGFIARRLCPGLILVPVDFKKYIHYSDLTRKVFQNYDSGFMATSLDEAYLDITKICKERAITGGEVAEELRTSVYEETSLTCSAGVAPNRLLAKICSDINKPNGQFVLPNDRMAVMTFVSSLPIRKIGGIGKVTEHVLKDVFGISTCEEMLLKSSVLFALFSPSSAGFFLSVGLGLGGTNTPQAKLRKSISNERTFSATADEAFFHQKLVDLAEMLSADMKKEGLYGRTLTLKLKTASFEIRTRAVTLQKYICSSEDILKHASKLLKAEVPVSLRLIGLRMSQFNEDKNGAQSDPTQKTISNYLISGDACGKNMGDNLPLGSDASDSLFLIDTETDLPNENQMTSSDYAVPVYCNQTSGLNDGDCMLSYDTAGIEPCHRPLCNESNDEVEDANMMGNKLKPCDTGASHLVETDSFSLSEQFEGSSLDRLKESANMSCNEAGSSANRKEPFFWVNDYKCSLCGVELPLSFLEERQEHSDFHLAERLQQEESVDLMLKQRFIRKDHIVSHSPCKKKHKSSPTGGKHLPIDMFFVKTSQKN